MMIRDDVPTAVRVFRPRPYERIGTLNTPPPTPAEPEMKPEAAVATDVPARRRRVIFASSSASTFRPRVQSYRRAHARPKRRTAKNTRNEAAARTSRVNVVPRTVPARAPATRLRPVLRSTKPFRQWLYVELIAVAAARAGETGTMTSSAFGRSFTPVHSRRRIGTYMPPPPRPTFANVKATRKTRIAITAAATGTALR